MEACLAGEIQWDGNLSYKDMSAGCIIQSRNMGERV